MGRLFYCTLSACLFQENRGDKVKFYGKGLEIFCESVTNPFRILPAVFGDYVQIHRDFLEKCTVLFLGRGWIFPFGGAKKLPRRQLRSGRQYRNDGSLGAEQSVLLPLAEKVCFRPALFPLIFGDPGPFFLHRRRSVFCSAAPRGRKATPKPAGSRPPSGTSAPDPAAAAPPGC